MREIDRFEVRADDGRTWRFALMERQSKAQEYVSLDDRDRFYINANGIAEGQFLLVDFGSDAKDVEVTRV